MSPTCPPAPRCAPEFTGSSIRGVLSIRPAPSLIGEHRYGALIALSYDVGRNRLDGNLQQVLDAYIGADETVNTRADGGNVDTGTRTGGDPDANVVGRMAPLTIDEKIALMRMLRLDFGSDKEAYEDSIQNAFFAAGVDAALSEQYADRSMQSYLVRVTGTDGTDVMQGTEGNDYLRGGDGNDTYVWGRGQGDDNIDDDNGYDRAILVGLNPTDIALMRGNVDGDKWIIVIRCTGESLGFYKYQFPRSLVSQYGVEQIVFDDGTTWDTSKVGEIAYGGVHIGTNGADGLSWLGTFGPSYFAGNQGDDRLSGGSWSDTYAFARGDGSDSIHENLGVYGDRLHIHGYLPSDVTLGRGTPNTGSLVMTFAGTDDRITMVYGPMADGRDGTLLIEEVRFDDGTVWNSEDVRRKLVSDMKATGAVIGTGYADIYRHTLGDGSYTITDSRYFSNSDRLIFADIDPDEVTVSHNELDAVLTLTNGETVILINQLLYGFIANRFIAIEEIEFADGTVWSRQDLSLRMVADMKAAGMVVGTRLDDTFRHTLGDGSYTITDSRETSSYSDRLIFTDRNPDEVTVSRNGDDAVLTLTNGESVTVIQQLLNGPNAIEEIEFADGTVWSKQDLRLRMVADMKTTGIVVGTWQDDTYHHTLGDGSYTIADPDFGPSSDRLIFTDGNPDEVTVSRNGEDAVLTLANGETVTLIHQFRNADYGIEEIEFADGTVWSRTNLEHRLPSDMATGGDDIIHGFTGDDTLRGMDGDDILHGGRGDDTVRGMEGDDILYGDSGDDALFGGRDNDVLHGSDGNDCFDGGPGIDTVDFSYSNAAADFDLTTGQVVFDGGFTETLESIENAIGTEGDNTITGTDDANQLWGRGGNDTLRGMDGNDTLGGGHGDDTVRGMEGDDILYGDVGDDALFGGRDNDVLHGSDGNDCFDGGPGIDTVDFSYSNAAADFDLTTGQVVFDGGFTETLESIENAIGTEGDNTITGTDDANQLWGRGGNDTLRGMDGNDTLGGGHGDDTVRGMEGDDILYGDVGDDALFGGKGNDVLHGSNGNDTLDGGGGADVLIGGAGADTFVFGRFNADDTIEDFEDGVDTIRIDIAGMSFADLTISDDDGDALLSYSAGDTIRLSSINSENLDASDFAFA